MRTTRASSYGACLSKDQTFETQYPSSASATWHARLRIRNDRASWALETQNRAQAFPSVETSTEKTTSRSDPVSSHG